MINHAAPPLPASNAANLECALDELTRVIRARLKSEDITADGEVQLRFFDDGSPLGNFIRERKPPFTEYLVMFLALLPHVRPGLLDREIRAALSQDTDLAEIGGIRDPDSRAFLPTAETALFLLAGDDLEARFDAQRLFSADHWFSRDGVLRVAEPVEGASLLSGRLIMARDWVERFTVGRPRELRHSTSFPASRITTPLDWSDLVLEPAVMERIGELHNWVRHRDTLMRGWGMANRLRPGYRVLFHGPPGTGKTLTATLLGKATQRDVYRVELSTVVSKYIGETEKNLAQLFDQARHRDWILFFDEADALFGKRTGVKDAHDRYANQEISYLLQRVEEFDGLVILASNLRSNIDDAFSRRFNDLIRFPFPNENERQAIWSRMLPPHSNRDRLVGALSGFELSGGNIANVVQFAALRAIAGENNEIQLEDALIGIQREYEKEGKLFRNGQDQAQSATL